MGVREIGTEEEREGRWEWGGERDRRRGKGSEKGQGRQGEDVECEVM